MTRRARLKSIFNLKISENVRNPSENPPKSLVYLWQPLLIFGNLWKSSAIFGNLRVIFGVLR